MVRFFDEAPPEPPREDFDAWLRVEAYWAWLHHRAAITRSDYVIVSDGDSVILRTGAGEQLMTDELAERLGWDVQRDDDGNVIGWSP